MNGTINHPATIITAKKTTFISSIAGIETLSPPLKKLIVTASKTTTRISSTTAAPNMVVPSLEFNLFISFKVCTEMLTEVAEITSAKKTACSVLQPSAIPRLYPPIIGNITPPNATASEDFQLCLSCSKSVSRPAINIRSNTPICEK
ncbi:hypothetical protein D3C77_502380 [compost metagenome]